MSARTAGIPTSTHVNPPVPELIPLSEALPRIGIALCCIWAAYTITELPEVATSTVISPEVAADAAEPRGVVTLAAVPAEAMALAAVSSEVVAYAAEPPEAAVLVSSPCMVVAPNNVLSTCHVAVKETVTEHYLSPGVTTVEPPEVAASAAEPSEVSVVPSCVSIYDLSACPVTAIEAVCEASCCPVTSMEAVCDLLPCSELAMEACHELLSCPNPTKEAISELSELLSCPESAEEAAYELPAPSVTTEEVIGELLDCSDAAIRAVQELSSLHVTAMKTVNELPVCPINLVTSPVNTCERSVCLIHETNGELSTCSVFQQVFDFPVYQEPVNSAKLELSVLPVSIDDFTMELSACLVSSNVPDYDPSVLSVSVWEPNYELSARSVSPNRSNVESSVCPISSNVFEVSVSPIAIHEPVICPLSPVTTPETLTELPVGSSSLVTAQRPTFELLTLPVVNSETINVLYVCLFPLSFPKKPLTNCLSILSSVNESKFKSHVLSRFDQRA